VTTCDTSHPLELAANPERHLGLVSLIVDLPAHQRYVTGEICPKTLNGPYLWGLSFLEGILMCRLHASNHTLLPGTKVC
jgi:hypothetical protein